MTLLWSYVHLLSGVQSCGGAINMFCCCNAKHQQLPYNKLTSNRYKYISELVNQDWEGSNLETEKLIAI